MHFTGQLIHMARLLPSAKGAGDKGSEGEGGEMKAADKNRV